MFLIVWSNLNYTFFACLMILGIVQINTGDPAWGWPMVVISGVNYLVYGLLFVLSPLMQSVAEDCQYDESGNVIVPELLLKTAIVIAIPLALLWVTVITAFMAVGSLHGEPCGVETDPGYAGQVETVCRVAYWPGWFK